MARPSVDPRSFLPLTPLAFQVLLALADTERHGYGIIREVDERTDGLVRLRTGTLYTLLQRLFDEELIEDAPAPTADNRASERRGAAPPPRSFGEPRRSSKSEDRGTPPLDELGASRASRGTPIKHDERRKYYRLTDLGRGVLSAEARRLELLIGDARRKHVLGRTGKA